MTASDTRNEESELGKKPATGIEPTVPPEPEAPVTPEPVVEPLSGPKNDKKGVGGLDPKYSFMLAYTDQRGFLWQGTFSCHVMTVRDRVALGLTRARLMGGMPLQSVDHVTTNILEQQAHLAVAVDQSPPWAKDMSEIYEVGVLNAIYEEVASYEARFWGADDGAASEVDEKPE